MTKFTRSIAMILALTAASAAGAETSDSVVGVFSYQKNRPALETYQQFTQVAKRACRIDYRQAGGYNPKWQAERGCVADLLSKAVKATNDPALLALHTGKPNRSADPQLAAAR